MSISKKTIEDFLKEVKAAIKESFKETTDAIKNRLRKLLIISIIGIVLIAVVVSFIGSAVLFILLGSYKYLTLFLPAWEAWIVMGITALVIGIIFLVAVFLIVRSQLKSDKSSETSGVEKKST